MLLFLAFVLAEAADPYGDEAYIAIPHGNHEHYVPRDRDPRVPLSSFPTQPPRPNERILPDGRVVPNDTLRAPPQGP